MSKNISLELLAGIHGNLDIDKLIKQHSLPVIGGKVDSLLASAALAVDLTKAIHWNKPAAMSELSKVKGLGAAHFCLQDQLDGRVRIWLDNDSRSKHLSLFCRGKKEPKYVRLYGNGDRMGEDASTGRFQCVTGFLKEGAADTYVFMGLHSDFPFMWAIPRKRLEKEWWRIDSRFGGNPSQATYTEEDIFRVPPRQWTNEGGFMQLRIPMRSEFALARVGQLGF